MALVTLNVGSNTERRRNLNAGLDALAAQFGELQLSSVYESEAVGFAGKPFLNLALALHTNMPVAELAHWLRQLEYAQGRPLQASSCSPRTLDIDLLTYAGRVGSFDGVNLPRPEILYSAHVLGPLAELCPAELHPLEGISYAELWEKFPHRERIWRFSFTWPN